MAEVAFSTSGTSGAAKTVVRTEASLRADASALLAAFPEIWSTHSPVVASVPADHMYGALWRVRAPALAGCAVDAETVITAEQLMAARERYGRVLFVTTPSFLEKLVEHPDCASLRGAFVAIVTSGSLLRPETSRAVTAALGTCPLEIFGSTEAGSVASRRRCESELWTLLPSVDAAADAERRLVIRSPFAAEAVLTMSDAVEFVDERHFRLLGRTDRQVKILENFVSLPAVETAFEGHSLVGRCRAEAYGDSVPRIGALVVLSEEGVERLKRGTCGALLAQLRRDLLPVLGGAAFPRRVRFVRCLPVDARGKVTADRVRAALAAWCREPAVTDWRQTEGVLTAVLTFPPDCECFTGHFPGCPVLPGVAQLVFLRHFARQAFADFPDAATYRQLKFQKLVLPGREVVLTVKRRGEGAFAFELSGASGRCSSGLVERAVTK